MSDPGTDQEYPNKATKGDHAHTAARAVLSLVPYANGPILEVMSGVIAPPLAKRRDEWFVRLGARITELEGMAEALSLERPRTNESFISACANAMLIAIRTRQEEKLEALVWAKLNSALELDPEGIRESMFMRLIDELTPLHLRVLRVLNDPEASLARTGMKLTDDGSISYRRMLEEFFPDVFQDDALPNQIIKDLKSRGLIDDTLRARGASELDMPAFRLKEQPQVPDMGRRFLRFIMRPVPAATGMEGNSDAG